MVLYQDFRERLDRGLREHNIGSTYGIHVSMDTNQAGATMTSRYDVSKHGLSFALVPGAGKISYSIGKTVLGFSRPGSVLKVMWPLLLTDNPPGILLRYIEAMSNRDEKSRSQDEKSRPSGRPVKPKTLRGTKTFKTGSSGQTSKPFWANGKPKCKKGFRYDFKRKLCVKIK